MAILRVPKVNFIFNFKKVGEVGLEPRKGKAADFDSAIRRFESSRPSQYLIVVSSYLASDTFGSSISFRTLICPSFRTFVAGSFARRCAWRLRVADNARSKVSLA